MKIRSRYLIERAPLPAAGALWAAASGLVVAFLWHWKGMLFWNLGILIVCFLDYGLTFRGKDIQAHRRSPRHLLQKVSQEIEIVLSNWAELPKTIKVRDQTPLGWEAAPVLKSRVPARSEVILRYPVTQPCAGRPRDPGSALPSDPALSRPCRLPPQSQALGTQADQVARKRP
jgi:hypothetical protein